MICAEFNISSILIIDSWVHSAIFFGRIFTTFIFSLWRLLMANFNSVTLLGNASRDTECRYTPSGTAVADIGLAVNDRIKKGDTFVDITTFVDVTVWGKTAEVAAQYVTKGKQILINGSLRMDSWEKDRVKRSKHFVNCNTLQLVGGKS